MVQDHHRPDERQVDAAIRRTARAPALSDRGRREPRQPARGTRRQARARHQKYDQARRRRPAPGTRLTGTSASAYSSACRPVRAPSGSITGSIGNPARRVVVAVHPRDRHEVRNLPEEDDREQRPAAGVDRSAAGRPADERRQRAGHGADQRRDRRPPLQRRVDGEVDDQRRGGDERREQVRRSTSGCRDPPRRARCRTRVLRLFRRADPAAAAAASASSARRCRARRPGSGPPLRPRRARCRRRPAPSASARARTGEPR